MEEDFFAPKKELIVIGDENVNLQDSFKKFREQKIRERHILKMCRGGLGCAGNRSEEYKSGLRQKFIDGLKKVIIECIDVLQQLVIYHSNF